MRLTVGNHRSSSLTAEILCLLDSKIPNFLLTSLEIRWWRQGIVPSLLWHHIQGLEQFRKAQVNYGVMKGLPLCSHGINAIRKRIHLWDFGLLSLLNSTLESKTEYKYFLPLQLNIFVAYGEPFCCDFCQFRH